MLTCFVLAGQIMLSSPTDQTVIFPEGSGVQIRPDTRSYTRIRFFGGSQLEAGEERTLSVPYYEVVEAISNCEKD